ncbi:excinuclease ABC subunit UvrA [Candidatus Woesebacteria bacterium]|nr:excinuclease ABC subunit UvrA [Candidatus Woesebacteria bacterium]
MSNEPQFINIKGAREHNLQNIDLQIPKNQLVVLTGLSGSGKSSLAFDTLYAEGQRRYVESLSSYARQFLGLMKKPEVESIDGLSPAISIDQKTTSHNPRSTVGTITEIYDYLRLLYARVGHPSCPNCGREVSTQTVDQIVSQVLDEIETRVAGDVIRLAVLAPVIRERKGSFGTLLSRLEQQGYRNVRIDKEFLPIDGKIELIKTNRHSISVILNRISWSKQQQRSESERKRLRSDLVRGIEEALKLSDGFVTISFIQDQSFSFPENPKEYEDILFSEKLACSHCNVSLPELEPRLFSFNAPEGACPTCTGLGALLKIDVGKIIAPSLSLSEGAVIPFSRTLSTDTWWSRLVEQVVAQEGYDFRKTMWSDFDEKMQEMLLHGSSKLYTVEGENREGRKTTIQEKFEGFVHNLERRYQETESEFMRREIGQYMQKQVCPSCSGARLNQDALAVSVEKRSIAEVTQLPIDQCLQFAQGLLDHEHTSLSEKEWQIGETILKEIVSRLEFLSAVGLNYLSLSREAGTLAGGEAQRIRLASQIGTGLSGVLYILDEPTIGLHQRDNQRLIQTLQNLRDKGNTVVVVEHDEEVIRAADYVFDFGPGAGRSGGKIVAHGKPNEIQNAKESLTGQYLSGKKQVERKKKIDKAGSRALVSDDDAGTSKGAIRIEGATHHNLKSLDINFPLNKLVCITGVSGSGKSTLLHDTLYYHLATNLGYRVDMEHSAIDRLLVPDVVKKVYLIDQKPIGKTPRSNPATYSKAFDYIRQLFALTPDARIRNYKPGRFSFNTKGGRCEACQGDGQIKIEMQFLADVYVTCDVCQGKRYNEETLSVEYRGKTIDQVLHLTVDEAYDFFQSHGALKKKLGTLKEVGLGYLELGQPAPTLSGGEAQRLKLAKELAHQTSQHNVYLLDEPTTGLHFADTQKLLNVLSQLVNHENTVIVIEHNLDIIRNADWIIDLGPEGGAGGGEILYAGPPTAAANQTKSITGKFL